MDNKPPAYKPWLHHSNISSSSLVASGMEIAIPPPLTVRPLSAEAPHYSTLYSSKALPSLPSPKSSTRTSFESSFPRDRESIHTAPAPSTNAIKRISPLNRMVLPSPRLSEEYVGVSETKAKMGSARKIRQLTGLDLNIGTDEESINDDIDDDYESGTLLSPISRMSGDSISVYSQAGSIRSIGSGNVAEGRSNILVNRFPELHQGPKTHEEEAPALPVKILSLHQQVKLLKAQQAQDKRSKDVSTEKKRNEKSSKIITPTETTQKIWDNSSASYMDSDEEPKKILTLYQQVKQLKLHPAQKKNKNKDKSRSTDNLHITPQIQQKYKEGNKTRSTDNLHIASQAQQKEPNFLANINNHQTLQYALNHAPPSSSSTTNKDKNKNTVLMPLPLRILTQKKSPSQFSFRGLITSASSSSAIPTTSGSGSGSVSPMGSMASDHITLPPSPETTKRRGREWAKPMKSPFPFPGVNESEEEMRSEGGGRWHDMVERLGRKENSMDKSEREKEEERRRESLRGKIVLVGVTDQSPDGRVSEWL